MGIVGSDSMNMECECSENGGWCKTHQRMMSSRLAYLCRHSCEYRAIFDRQYAETKKIINSQSPPIHRMAISFLRSLFIWSLDRFRFVENVERHRICSTCPGNTGYRCRPCGCFLWLKTRMPHESCPAGLWGPVLIVKNQADPVTGELVQIQIPRKSGCGCGK